MAPNRDEDSPRRAIQRGSGCVLASFVLGAAMIAAGTYLMGRWERIGGPGRAGAVVLVVLGTLLAAPLVLLSLLMVFIRRATRRIAERVAQKTEPFAKAGQGIVDLTKQIYGQVHEFRAATEADFDKLDRTAYDAATRELESRGFRQLGDVVDSTIEKLRGMTPVLRVFASADGAIKAAAYHFVSGPTRRQPDGLQLFVCDLGTEFTDGTFLASSNTEGVDLMTPPPTIRKLLRPPGTPIGVLLAAHESEQKAVLAVNPSLSCVPVRTLADALAAAEREQAVKNAFRKEIGFADPEEVRRIARERNVSEEVANGTAHAVDRARRREQGRG